MGRAICVLALLGGCTVGNGKPPKVQTEQVKVTYSVQPIDELIYAAHNRATKAQEDLRDALAEKHGVKAARTPKWVPAELLQPVSLTWTGPIAEAVEQLAKKAEFTFQEHGSPTNPVMVEVSATNQPIVLLLTNLGNQATSRADIVLNVDQRSIEVFYATQ